MTKPKSRRFPRVTGRRKEFFSFSSPSLPFPADSSKRKQHVHLVINQPQKYSRSSCSSLLRKDHQLMRRHSTNFCYGNPHTRMGYASREHHHEDISHFVLCYSCYPCVQLSVQRINNNPASSIDLRQFRSPPHYPSVP